jgi:hypothetical protein
MGQLPNFAASYKDDYDYFIGNETDCSRTSHLCGSLIMIAVLVIGSIAAAQAFPSKATGWTTLGLGGGYMVIKLLGKDCHARRADLIATACIASLMLIFGILGVTHVLTSLQVGYALLGIAGLTACVTIGMMMGAKQFCPRPSEAV